jgi:hypothetical protein
MVGLTGLLQYGSLKRGSIMGVRPELFKRSNESPGARWSMSAYRISEHSSRGWHPFVPKAEVAERNPKTMGFEEQTEL